MSFQLITDIGHSLYSVFGSPLVFTLVAITFLITLLFVFRAPLSAIAIVVIPVLVGFVLNSGGAGIIELPKWILLASFIFVGLLFGGFYLFFIK